MTSNEMFLDACQGIVMNCNRQILVIRIMDEWRAVLTQYVRLPNREVRYSEVLGQDITRIVKNVQSNFQSMTEQRLNELVQSICVQTFKFETKDYIWLTKVDLNRG
jgi:hypothetical protein